MAPPRPVISHCGGYWRADRLRRPKTGLPTMAINGDDCWCDDPLAGQYNKAVKLPFVPSCERLGRADHLYDVLVAIGYNDGKPKPFLGSAIFIHAAQAPTAGCIGMRHAELLELLAGMRRGSRIIIYA